MSRILALALKSYGDGAFCFFIGNAMVILYFARQISVKSHGNQFSFLFARWVNEGRFISMNHHDRRIFRELPCGKPKGVLSHRHLNQFPGCSPERRKLFGRKGNPRHVWLVLPSNIFSWQSERK
jgi:hypothetical protein